MVDEAESKPRSSSWGEVFVLEEAPHYRIKRVEIEPGKQMTLHQHHHRSEHWVVTNGTVMVVCEGKETIISTGESTYVPPCTPHRLMNPGVIPARLMEIQNGEYLGEDDMEVIDFEPYPLQGKDNAPQTHPESAA